ncbi:MAG: calmodulin [Planctomycetaceae bacterium]
MSNGLLRGFAAGAVMAVLGCTWAMGDEPDARAIVTAAVKSLPGRSTAASDTVPDMSMVPASPAATLPAERLPQYRIGYQRSDAMLQSQIKDGTVRFLLTDPAVLVHTGRPLLLEAKILIDGEPFSDVRNRLAAKYLTALSSTATSDPEPSAPDQTTAVETDAVAKDGVEPAAESAQSDSSAAEDDPAEEAVTPASEPDYRITSDSQELLRRYAEAIGESAEEAESQWLMTHWTDGPALLVLPPYYQSFRAEQRPAFVVLDKDRNGVLSAAELDEAAGSFERCDADRDQIVDALEIAKAAEALRDPSETPAASGPLFWLLPDLVGVTEQDSLLYQSIAALDSNQNGIVEAAEIDSLSKQTPDLSLSIAFDSDDIGSSKLHVVGVAQNLSTELDPSGAAINASIGYSEIQVSAIQSSMVQPHSGQISIGAVVDGYPLLPELDPNGDRRFTIRELRTLTQRLREMDRNADQALDPSECLSPIRICIGLGPTVHEELANVRSVLPTTSAEATSGPEWFVRMDRNQDGDLTRSEFPGIDEQFAALDADGDSLVSASEANQFDQQAEK